MLTNEKLDALYERLGELIKTAREQADIKQELLADYLDLSRVSISNIEKGKQKIQIHTLLELAKYLQKDITTFLYPLNDLLADIVTDKEEKRISSALEFPAAADKQTDDGTKVKEFVNFLKSKNNSD